MSPPAAPHTGWMSGYKLEDGVPLPNRGLQATRAYPFPEMKVGQSFLVPFEDDKKLCCERVRKAVHYRSKSNPGERYTTRVVDGGIRVWRLA